MTYVCQLEIFHLASARARIQPLGASLNFTLALYLASALASILTLKN